MYGGSPSFPHGSGSQEAAQPPQPPSQQQLLVPQFAVNNYLQSPNDLLYFQNHNLLCHNSLLLNHNNIAFPNTLFQAQNNSFRPQNPGNHCLNFPRPQLPRPNVIENIDRIEREVVKARHDILVSGDNVSSWKVSQAVLLAMKADSWESLGFQMQQIPSLHSLIVTEGKINSFIHCFVGVRRITTLYDLELAICENEGVEQFEELELGPLVRHPLVGHYFSISSDVKEVLRITSEEIISNLHEFMDSRRGKEVKIDELLDFIAKKRSLTGREKLNVRIQSLGWHISHIRKALRSENATMKKYVDGLKKKFGIKTSNRPLLSSQKKQMDDRFNHISERVQSFSSGNVKFCGKHTRFSSSGSDDGDSNETDYEDNQDADEVKSHSNLTSLQSLERVERVSSCPYPSAAEEMTRLGLKPEVDDSPVCASANARNNGNSELHKRKRKSERAYGSSSVPRKVHRRDKDETILSIGNKKKESFNEDMTDSAYISESTRTFIATWKEACREDSVDKVLDRMLHFYNNKKKKKLKTLFSSHPFAGLLDVTVKSIKLGIWDSMYDAFQTFGHHGAANSVSNNQANYKTIEVERGKEDGLYSAKTSSRHECGVLIDDIVKKVSSYFELADDELGSANPSREKKFGFFRKLCRCESWLTEQFQVKEFVCFGYGDFMSFMDKHLHLLPEELQKSFIGEKTKELSFKACMLQLELDVLLSQASTCIWQDEKISKQMILKLLRRQFPSFCFKSVQSDSIIYIQDVIRESEAKVSPKCVLFSATLFEEPGIIDPMARNEKFPLDSAGFEIDIDHKMGSLGSVTTKDAIEVLLKAPMLTDLDSWSHWNLIYAPSLGPLMLWLLNEVNTKELLCLVTKGGKIIRLDHSATVDSFLEVLIKRSAFETAVKLLSLLALYGGERNVPLSLLKCCAQKAFQVLIENSMERELYNVQDFFMRRDLLSGKHVFEKDTCGNLTELHQDVNQVNKGVAVASRFILDCLSYLPTEFCSFSAKVLLAGVQAFAKNAPLAILSECKRVEQRVMLHDVGFSLGIVEWINDYHTFRSSEFTNSIFPLEPSNSKAASYDTSVGLEHVDNALKDAPSFGVGLALPNKADENVITGEATPMEQISEVSVHASPDIPTEYLRNPNEIIESIRREEFGLDPSLSATEHKMLKKQHARLGRALHCLSHELYSQDSHFLLELVQNADDNIYPENAEPTLIFVLQEKGIVILNNEIGFSAKNIRALCDVGNSTKRGKSAGYIGKKGIGFKSVFRVTNAPEIHSNGFHIKFDITEGQIGFVLPTEVPPFDINHYTRLVCTDTDKMDCNSWRTCIVLPFKTNLSAGFTTSNILSMFSDLHPSLLLFLHRLQCIKFRDLLNDSLIVMRKEVLRDGIIKVSLGKEKMFWFVVSHKLQADTIRPDVQSTEISLAFTLEETDDGDYIPQLNQQPVFAFLPLRTYGLKFILQGDFVLPSSREEVDGDSPWNQWLLSEFPGLFVTAERSFCDLPCFRRSLGKAVTAFMSFVPLLGEVHGFFSCLPRMIISKLRMSNCLLLESSQTEWVPPCKVLRNWDEQARALLPERLLREHLGLGFLKKDILLPDSLARALGIEEYGPKTLLHIMSSLSRSESALKLMGLGWVSAWINSIYLMSLNSVAESELIVNLKKIPFIPLSDGTYGSADRGTIWLHSGNSGVDNEYDLKAFPKLYAKLQTVSHELFSAAAAAEKTSIEPSTVDNVTRMLLKVGVQKLSAHEIVKVHILPAISHDRYTLGHSDLMVEYLSFIMFHLESGCCHCCQEKEWIIKHLQSKALILTNYGFKRLNEVPIHFNKEFGSPIDVNELINGIDIRWHEVDCAYLRHPITKSVCDGKLKWRNFFCELGVTDFIQIVQVEKCVGDISSDVLKDMIWDSDTIPTGSIAKDWESPELVHLLSNISSGGDPRKCEYLLEILDLLWDDCFDDKVWGDCKVTSSAEGKPFKSSFVRILQNVKWMVSIMDDDFHYPKDLFDDCEAVRSVLGVTAPYVVPKVKSQKLLSSLGLKKLVRFDDILEVLKIWRRTEKPIKASISQMLNFYTFIWNEMSTSKQTVAEELFSGPFIFVPYESVTSVEDVVAGSLLCPKDIYWHDKTGSVDQMQLMHLKCVSDTTHLSVGKMLCNVYPTLHDFFVNECGVREIPPFSGYLQILLQLSTIYLPSQAARNVFDVFSVWAEGFMHGSLSNDDVEYLKESLQKKECVVLPTAQDKWVSLHPSFGLICWSDDDSLRKEFKHLDGIDLLYFGDLRDGEKDKLQTNVAILLKRLGIPALSGVVSREAIYYGPTDSSFKASLVNWALPYAQRYMYHLHPDEYLQRRKSIFESLRCLQIVVVEKLFYRNVIRRCEIASKKRFECNCLLEGNILHATRESDSHSIFMELSSLLFGEAPQLHLANFLHMITTMAEAGSTENQMEFFILNSQKVPKLPVEESIWSLSSTQSLPENDESTVTNSVSESIDESNFVKTKRRPGMNSNWPPVNWRTAPGFNSVHANRLTSQVGGSLYIREADDATELNGQTDHLAEAEKKVNLTSEPGPVSTSPAGCLGDTEILEDVSNHAGNIVISGTDMVFDNVDHVTVSNGPLKFGSLNSSMRNQQSLGATSTQAHLTGRVGEFVAFKYFVGKAGEKSVKWVNEANETGLPYDIIIGSDERGLEYVEVKATKSAMKDWFEISVREWQFAVEKGESFSIAHVLLDNVTAKVTVYKNPLKLCQLSKLRLAVVMPKQLELSNMA